MLMLEDYQGESVLIAATNHPQLLDSGVWRRFDDVIRFELPNTLSRIRLYEKKMGVIQFDTTIDLASFADLSENFSGSDIEQVANRAMKNALLDKRKRVTKDDVEKAINRQKEMILIREKV